MEDEDFALALKLYEELNETDSATATNNKDAATSNKKEQEKNLSIVDPSWELIDPVPDIRELFVQFNAEFFDGMLACVEVKWSTRMTLCAGVCCYQPRGGYCSIKLSQPLLKLRPRKDLVETLLHEMIHALLFVTRNNKDHDGHGPEFHKHMFRINKQTGTNITVYHSFHDEVNEYRQHWWRCDGPCLKRPPYYGIVRRAMNRPPAPRDTWWNEHQRKCGGKFTKIKEPEKPVKKGKTKAKENDSENNPKAINNNKTVTKPVVDDKKAITNWFQKKNSKNSNNSSKGSAGVMSRNKGSSTVTSSKNIAPSDNEIYQSSSANSSSNIFGFKMSANNKTQPVPIASFSGQGQKLSSPVAGAANKQRSNFLSKMEANMKMNKEKNGSNSTVDVSSGKTDKKPSTDVKNDQQSSSTDVKNDQQSSSSKSSSNDSFLKLSDNKHSNNLENKAQSSSSKASRNDSFLKLFDNKNNSNGVNSNVTLSKTARNDSIMKSSAVTNLDNSKRDLTTGACKTSSSTSAQSTNVSGKRTKRITDRDNDGNSSADKLNDNEKVKAGTSSSVSLSKDVFGKRMKRITDDDDELGTSSKKRKSDNSAGNRPPVVHVIDDGGDDGGVPVSANCLVDCPACPAKVPVHELNKHLDSCLS